MMQKVEIKVQDGAEAVRVVACTHGAGWQVRITVEDVSGRPAVSEHALALLERQVPGINRALEALA